MNSILSAIQNYDSKLKKRNILNGKQEIIWYLESKNLITQEQLYSTKQTLSPVINDAIKLYYNLRITEMPHQYILNSSNFYGRDFYVDKCVLIPRPETEQIIDIVKQFETPFNSCLEIGIGSGCIALTLCLENIVNKILGTDISAACLNVTQINQRHYNVENLILLQHDILQETFNETFDLIISNPPYITEDEFSKLPNHIKKFEPEISLTDYSDGLVFYKRFSAILSNILSPKGVFICELGSQRLIPSIKQLFINQGYRIKLYSDLNNDTRFLVTIPPNLQHS